ncbi:reductive dehalogenase [Dehalococcoides mccartyi]|uniref:Reductive dehalogenase n=1 Tax=Dehalococcoides mccartyi (strain CBDB1) TaxID=255470 RepID=A0A916KLH8_DEHMC|nr:reductive dehalogenase [Dehalococcoides mccartyi]CAI82358.1 putative reductive dehalogenase [Dehalococcoides mccartyi CBDB1]
MSQFHSILSRRDFMKSLGLASAGIGAASLGGVNAAAPFFHDVDEITSSPSAITKKPWWVKLQDKPTVPMDLSLLQPGRTKVWCMPPDDPSGPVTLRAPGYSEEETRQKFTDYFKKEWGTWDPGPTMEGFGDFPERTTEHIGPIRDNALLAGLMPFLFGKLPDEIIAAEKGQYLSYLLDKPCGWRYAAPLEQRGGTKWQGTPEENLRTVRAAARFYGADDVGAIEVDEDFLRVMWGVSRFPFIPVPVQFEWGDVDDFVPTPSATRPTKIIIPRRCKYFVHWTMRQPPSRLKHDSGTQQGPSQGWTYSRNPMVNVNIQEFLWGLGYIALTNWSGYLIPTGYAGVASGAGELSRWSGVLTPKFGNQVRGMYGFLTDLPLAPTKPINFGGYEFCKTCGICADACPMGAIQKGEPSWDASEIWQNPGYLGWRLDLTKCSHCPVCQGVCPFNTTDDSFVHNLVKGTIPNIKLFNGFFANMERDFGYGRKPYEDWWENAADGKEPVFGIDSTQ